MDPRDPATTAAATAAQNDDDRTLAELTALADRVVGMVQEQAAGSQAEVEANVRLTRTRHGLTRFAESFIHQHVGEDTRSVQLTVAVDGRTATATTTADDDERLGRLVADTLRSAALQPVDPFWPGATPPAPAAGPGNLDAPTAHADPAERAAQVRRFVAAGGGLKAAGYLDTEATWGAAASTAGQRIAGGATRATVDGIHRTATSAGSAHQTSVRLGDLDAEAAGARAADLARRSERFVDLDPGELPVVLAPEAVATVLTFLAFYGFNAKMHLEGGSFVQLGEQQLDPAITVGSDPNGPDAIGLPFDAEGTPTVATTLIDRGVSRGLAHDRRTARRSGTGTVSTGSAVPGGEAFGAFPTNLVLGAGDRSVAELIATIERGLLVTTFNYVRILDPKTQVATGLTRNGTFLIEDGQVAGAVGNLRFTQSFAEALAPGAVLGVGDDARYADGEFGAGMVRCPSLALAGWRFTGGARG